MLAKPIGSPPFAELMLTRGKVAITVNDETRVARTDIFLPLLVNELNRIGVRDQQIFTMISNGTHLAMTKQEIKKKGERLFCSRTDRGIQLSQQE